MYWTKAKIAVIVLFLASLGGAGVSLLATQDDNRPPVQTKAAMPNPQPVQGPVEELARTEPSQVSEIDGDDEPAEDSTPPIDNPQPADEANRAHDMARSRLNLKKLAIAMQNCADTHQGRLPLAASVDKKGKALLSWRVELLPYLGEHDLYNQFKRDESWDSPHNRKLLSKMPAVFAAPGVKTQRLYSTFYQVFVSADPSAGAARPGAGAGMPGMGGPGSGAGPMMPGGMGPMMGGMPGGQAAGGAPQGGSTKMRNRMQGGPAGGAGMMGAADGPGGPGMIPPGGITLHAEPVPAFVKGKASAFPASFVDGASNTILIIEAGNPVPWTKPEDLHYAEDEPLPELGGLFPNVIHAAFADGSVHTLTKNYNKKQLRLAITANDGTSIDLSKIETPSLPRAGGAGERATVEAWKRKNAELRKQLDQARQQIQLLKDEQEVERELAGEDPRISKLKEENTRMQSELNILRRELDGLKKGTRQPQKP